MNFSTGLYLSAKGDDELKRRTYKLGLKKRSVLILLDQPRTIEFLLGKSVFPQHEIVEEIRALIGDQFVSIVGEEGEAGGGGGKGGAGVPHSTAPGGAAPVLEGNFHLDDEISIPEAKFLLVDFCVDHFGTRSQSLVDEIRACKQATALGFCLGKTFAAVQKHCPDQLPGLLKLVVEINETA